MKTLKKTLTTVFIVLPLLLLFANKASALTYDWTGVTSTNWTISTNWNVGGVQQTTSYPGDPGRAGSANDIVQFAVSYYYGWSPGTPVGSTTSRPILATGLDLTIGAMFIGDNSSTDHQQTDIYIRIDGTLRVTGAITQKHSDNIGLAGDDTPTFPAGYDYHIQTFFFGLGTVYAGSMQLGDNTPPTIDNTNNITRFKFGDPNTTAGLGLTTYVSGDVVINSVSRNDGAGKIISINDIAVAMNGGTLTVGGQLKLTNTGENKWTNGNYQPKAQFSIEVRNNGYNTKLYLQGANPLYCQPADPITGQIPANYFDFYVMDRNIFVNPPATINWGKTTVIYSGNVDQRVYTTASSAFPVYAISPIFDFNGGNYNYLEFSGSGRKIIDATNATYPLYISGDLIVDPGTEIVDLSTNSPTIIFNNNDMVFTSYGSVTPKVNYTYTIPLASGITTGTGSTFQNGATALTVPGIINNGGTFNTSGAGALTLAGNVINSGTFNQGGGTINLNNSYTNTGTFLATAGTVNLNGSQTLTDNSVAVVGNSVNGPKGGTTFFNLNAQGGSAKTLAGNGTGQFYIASQGTLNMIGTPSTSSLAANGFLTLLSDATGSAAFTQLPAGCSVTGNVTVQRYVAANRAYRLISSPVYTGTDGSGNNIAGLTYLKTNTVVTGSGGGFNAGGNPTLYLYRDNLAPLYTTFLNSNFRGIIDISGTPYTISDIDYPTANIPVGNGVLFYFRGSINQVSDITKLTTAGAPATTDTLNAVGQLNQGSITVHPWYTPANATLDYSTVSGDPGVNGVNLVGNPYASAIDFEAVTKTNLAPFAYYLIPTGMQGAGNYGIYDSFNHNGTNGATKVIPSGLGFFVIATGTGASLTFTEAAKVNTQVVGANLFMGKPPVENNTAQYLRMKVALDSINTDETIIAFTDNAQAGFNPAEDALYKVGTGKITLASLSSDAKVLAINRMPSLANGQTIPLKVSATASGTYTLKMSTITGIPQLFDVWLKDAFKKDSVNLRTTTSYSFTITTSDTSSFGSRRFSLVMRENPALAYQLLSFDANKVDNKAQVQLTWKAQNEQNYTRFTVERSTDNGQTFEVVGGQTSTAAGTYSLIDKSPAHGENQYRLKQEDYNNNITYSSIVPVMFANNSNNIVAHVSVFPNPTKNFINLTIVSKTQGNGNYDVRITNSMGTVVKYAVITQANWQDNVSSLLTGTYLVQVVDKTNNSVVGQTKFVKL